MTIHRWLLRTLVPLSLTLSLAGCAHLRHRRHETVEDVLRDYRGSSDWNSSREAFREIMREYVHGSGMELSDAELDADFETFLTLERSDVEGFIRSQSCMPVAGTEPSTYYVANSAHQRHDANYVAGPPHPLTGAGAGDRTLRASFSANMLLERRTVDANTEFPPRARNAANNHFKAWSDIVETLTDRARFDERFRFRDTPEGQAQAQRVFDYTRVVDWTRGSAEVFMAPEIDGGAFSPALFAVLLLRTAPDADPTVYLTVSANAGGQPQSPYVGLISESAPDPYDSTTQFAFTYLSDSANLLDHSLVLQNADTLAFELWIATGFPGNVQRPGPYLTVRTTIAPAASDTAIAPLRAGRIGRLIMMLRKGALMRDLIAAYYPRWPQRRLWEAVGALSSSRRFRRRLEAAGLSLAASVFESHLWLERPEVRSTAPTETARFAAEPAMAVRCEAPTP